MPIYVYMLYLRKMKEVIPNHHSKAQNVCLWPVEQLHYKQRRRFRWRNTWVDKVELIYKVLTFTQFKYNTFPNFFIILPHLTKKAQFLKDFFFHKIYRCGELSWEADIHCHSVDVIVSVSWDFPTTTTRNF